MPFSFSTRSRHGALSMRDTPSRRGAADRRPTSHAPLLEATFQLAACALALGTFGGCAALSYSTPEDGEPGMTTASEAMPGADSADAAGEMRPGTPEPPILISTGPAPSDEARETPADTEADVAVGEDFDAFDDPAEEPEQSWYTLTRAARDARQLGRFEEMANLLERARLLVAERPAESIQRRTVHGMRARLALDLLALGREDEANALADALFEEAESEPAVGGPATIELASRFSIHRTDVARADGLEASVLPLMRIALNAAESENPNRQRLGLAFEVAREAEFQGDLPLARKAIDRAIADSRILEAANLRQLATLELIRARVALGQGDLAEAERSAGASNRLLDETNASAPARAVGEATMAHVVAKRGDEDRARAIARTAQSRLGGDPPAPNGLARRVLGELARMERALGDVDAARAHYRAALDLPGTQDPADQQLVESLTRERSALDTPDPAPRIELEPTEGDSEAP